jgi:hypothetical protein
LAANPALIYVCVNIAAGAAALALVKEFEVFAPETGKLDHHLIYEAMLAGFGAIAFFRTSLFTVRVAGSDVGIGPSALLKALLDSSDMMLNRLQAFRRASVVDDIMGAVDFDKAKAALPTMCFTLLTEFPSDVQDRVGKQIAELDANAAIPKETKAKILGVYMIQQVGAEVLDRAVKALGTAIE